MYAIVDIETTGGYAANNDITEVAIVLHDGKKAVKRFESLVKPVRSIPYFIQVLTGISNEMVSTAPGFEELAPEMFSLLEGNIFIAHNVNFDYSFLRHHFLQAGYDLNCNKLCTVRLSKKSIPGAPSYSLGNLCRHLGIGIQQRHRAGGDADATVQLFEHLLLNDHDGYIQQSVKKSSREQSLPPHLPRTEIDKLPYTPGVYYFHDQKGQVIYVGKAKNLKYRVRSHFTNNNAGRQRQDFLRNIYSISFRECGTELMAFILESIEIKRLWPSFNYSQKKFTATYGLYMYEDRNGYFRLAIDKKKKHLQLLYSFNWLGEGHRLLNQLAKRFELCPRLCFIQTDHDECTGLHSGQCRGACEQLEPPETYNGRVKEAIHYLQEMLPTFAVVGEGYQASEQSCILMEKGRFYGMGYLPADMDISSSDGLKTYLTPYPENDYIRGLIYQYAETHPHCKIVL